MLLGAGASVDAGIPASFGLTEALVKRIQRDSRTDLSSALHFVCGALIAYDAAEGESPYRGLDVERVFAAVELLAERHELEVTPFVAAWHPAVDGWDRQAASVPLGFDRNFQRAVTDDRRGGFNTPSRLIMSLIRNATSQSATGFTYARLAGQMLNELRGLVATTRKQVDYLGPLVRCGRRRQGVTIASLNYDLSVELAAEVAGVRCTTGIERWITDGTWKWPTGGVRLLKLHGSIDWAWDRQEHVPGHLPRDVVTVSEEPTNEERRPVVVFGQRGKLRAAGPFLGLLGEFESHLAQADHLLVIGYSFRDDHVNEVIRRWTADDKTRMITAVDPFWPEDFSYEDDGFRAALTRHLIPNEHSEPQFPARLRVVRQSSATALAGSEAAREG